VTVRHHGQLTAAAQLQQGLWGTDPQGWAELAEPHNQPLFEALLDATATGTGTRLLDIGCGSGLLMWLAAGRGAAVTGVDVSPGLLAVAADRLPGADLWLADMQQLPFPDAAFDAVTAVNAVQFAADPLAALAEAARVCAPGGLVGLAAFAEPDRVQSTAVHLAMAALSPPERESAHAPYALSTPGGLEAALTAAGLGVAATDEVECVWRYQTAPDAVRALIGSAGGTRAVQDAGAPAVRAAIETALVPFTDPADGTIAMRNVFRWVTARRPGSGTPRTSRG
jgi:SAM-dependent methyltransferase